MLKTRYSMIAFVVVLSVDAYANDACRPIVAATVAELKAGAQTWDEGDQQLARAAAGAACVKALSGGYAGASIATQSAQSQHQTADDATEEAGEEDDSDWWPFKGFRRNDVSASPSKKPYDRKR